MVETIIEAKSNIGDKQVKMKIFSHTPLSDYEKAHISSLKRDEAIKYGALQGWKVIDIQDWN